MAYTEQEARELVIQAGLQLVKAGLIARTWGNISARISDTRFVITPSGLAYESLTPEQLVAVTIADCAYEGDIKPSSEKGIHADAYRQRPDVNFVIHTHQNKASVVGVLGCDLRAGIHFDGDYTPLLGKCVPCAEYGLPSTKKLRRAVAEAAGAYPESPAVLLPHHGTICMGRDYEHAFQIAAALEDACGKYIAKAFAEQGQEAVPTLPAPMPDYGNSAREEDFFRMERGGMPYVYAINAVPTDLPMEAAAHAQIYRHTDAAFIRHETDPQVVAVSAQAQTLRPLLDDLAQIAGADLRCAPPEPALIGQKAKGRNAVLVKGAGALCTGKTQDDLEAVALILRKGCEAERFAALLSRRKPLGGVDARMQRAIYVMKYSKQKQ